MKLQAKKSFSPTIF